MYIYVYIFILPVKTWRFCYTKPLISLLKFIFVICSLIIAIFSVYSFIKTWTKKDNQKKKNEHFSVNDDNVLLIFM